MPILIADPQIVELTGADAIAFAQAQFSSDLATLGNGQWQWSAWLSAQGRVRAFFHLLRLRDDRLLLWLRGGSAQALRDLLARFVFRAKLRITVLEGVHAVAGPAAAADELASSVTEIGLRTAPMTTSRTRRRRADFCVAPRPKSCARPTASFASCCRTLRCGY